MLYALVPFLAEVGSTRLRVGGGVVRKYASRHVCVGEQCEMASFHSCYEVSYLFFVVRRTFQMFCVWKAVCSV